jgi:hypothetical protein
MKFNQGGRGKRGEMFVLAFFLSYSSSQASQKRDNRKEETEKIL